MAELKDLPPVLVELTSAPGKEPDEVDITWKAAYAGNLPGPGDEKRYLHLVARKVVNGVPQGEFGTYDSVAAAPEVQRTTTGMDNVTWQMRVDLWGGYDGDDQELKKAGANTKRIGPPSAPPYISGHVAGYLIGGKAAIDGGVLYTDDGTDYMAVGGSLELGRQGPQ